MASDRKTSVEPIPRRPFAGASGKADSEERWVCWHAFLDRNRPSRTVFEAIRGPLRYCGRSHRTGVLGGHLVWLAVWGVIGPDTVDHLLRRYVQRAPSTARREALDDIGRALRQTTDPIEPDVIQRLRQLWEWWAQAAKVAQDSTDLAAFGWWFSGAVFDVSWSLAELDQTLVATGGILDRDHSVAEKLADLAGSAPNGVASCLERFVDADERHRLDRCRGSIRTALVRLATGPEGARARTMASRLVARGWREFLDLAGPVGG